MLFMNVAAPDQNDVKLKEKDVVARFKGEELGVGTFYLTKSAVYWTIDGFGFSMPYSDVFFTAVLSGDSNFPGDGLLVVANEACGAALQSTGCNAEPESSSDESSDDEASDWCRFQFVIRDQDKLNTAYEMIKFGYKPANDVDDEGYELHHKSDDEADEEFGEENDDIDITVDDTESEQQQMDVDDTEDSLVR